MHPYFHVFGLTLPAYGTMIALALLAAGTLGFFRTKKYAVSADDALIVSACAVGIGYLCAKLLFLVLTFPPAELVSRLKAGDVSMLNGGFVYYGGLIGGVLGALLGLRIAGCPAVPMLRALLPVLPLAHAIGRIGCFLSGCCYGRLYSGPFAVPCPIDPSLTCFPVQPAEALWNLLIFAVLLRADRRLRSPAALPALYAALYAAGRFALEFFRGDADRGLWNGFSTSQWISIAVFLLSLTFFLAAYKKDRS